MAVVNQRPAPPGSPARLQRALGDGVALIAVANAAFADADPRQRLRLRTELPGLMDEYKVNGDIRPLVRKFREVMGEEWKPTGEWRRWINRALQE